MVDMTNASAMIMNVDEIELYTLGNYRGMHGLYGSLAINEFYSAIYSLHCSHSLLILGYKRLEYSTQSALTAETTSSVCWSLIY